MARSFELRIITDRTGALCCAVDTPQGTRTAPVRLGPLGRISVRLILETCAPAGAWWLEPDGAAAELDAAAHEADIRTFGEEQ